MTKTGVVCLAPIGAILGEGPVWSAFEQAVWFVDIKGQKIHRYDTQDKAIISWDTPSSPGWILPTQNSLGDKGWMVGLQNGLFRFEPETGRFTKIQSVESHLKTNRLNDACVDPNGRLWFGTMDDQETEDSGRIYRYENGEVVDCGLTPVCITNGPAISPDGSILYHTDTLGGFIYASDLAADGMVSNTRLLVHIPSKEGYPDGPIVDAQGCIWTGLFAGWAARRYSPRGELLDIVEFPVANVTKLAFGGPDLKTLYATTASKGLSPARMEKQPLAGGLFTFQADVGGLLQNSIKLDV